MKEQPQLGELSLVIRGGNIYEVQTADHEILACLCHPNERLNLIAGKALVSLSHGGSVICDAPAVDCPDGVNPKMQELTAEHVALTEQVNVLTELLNRSLTILAQVGAFANELVGIDMDDIDHSKSTEFLIGASSDIMDLNTFVTEVTEEVDETEEE